MVKRLYLEPRNPAQQGSLKQIYVDKDEFQKKFGLLQGLKSSGVSLRYNLECI